MQAVTAANRPAGHHRDHDLRHEADQPLHFQDVQAAEPCGVDLSCRIGFVLVPILAADALIATRAKCPAAIFGRRAIAGEEDAADVRRLPRVVEHAVELVDRARPERVAHLGPIERDANRAVILGAVVGDVLQFEARHFGPLRRVEYLGNHVRSYSVNSFSTARMMRPRSVATC